MTIIDLTKGDKSLGVNMSTDGTYLMCSNDVKYDLPNPYEIPPAIVHKINNNYELEFFFESMRQEAKAKGITISVNNDGQIDFSLSDKIIRINGINE